MYELTNSPLELGLVNAVRAAPMLIFSVLAGALADRYGQMIQLVIAQTINAVLNVILAVLVLSGHIAMAVAWGVSVTVTIMGVTCALLAIWVAVAAPELRKLD